MTCLGNSALHGNRTCAATVRHARPKVTSALELGFTRRATSYRALFSWDDECTARITNTDSVRTVESNYTSYKVYTYPYRYAIQTLHTNRVSLIMPNIDADVPSYLRTPQPIPGNGNIYVEYYQCYRSLQRSSTDNLLHLTQFRQRRCQCLWKRESCPLGIRNESPFVQLKCPR